MLEAICQLAREAGDAIMQVYDGHKPMDVTSKSDDSPVTAADIAAHAVIAGGLQALTPDIPVLSEEDPPPGAFVSTGSVTGWSIRWTALKSL
jgi:3'(2'), 5'-bisphosphate nucleotidase